MSQGVARNMCVARGTAPLGANTVVYTVPANHVLLFKSFAAATAAAESTNVSVWLQDAAGVVGVRLVDQDFTNVDPIGWFNWVALNAGDRLLVGASLADVTYWISGALLAPWTGVPVDAVQQPGISYPFDPATTPIPPPPPPTEA